MTRTDLKIILAALIILGLIAVFTKCAKGAPVAGTVTTIHTDGDGDYSTMGIPRWRIYVRNDSIFAVPAQSGGDTAWAVSADNAATWNKVITYIGRSKYVDGHMHVSGDSDGLHTIDQDGTVTELDYQFIAWPATSSANKDPYRILITGNYIGSVLGVDSFTIAAIRAAGSNDSIIIISSTDHFTANKDTTIVNTTDAHETRMGMMVAGGVPIFYTLVADVGFCYWQWNYTNSDFEDNTDSMICPNSRVATDLNTRAYTVNYANGKIHLIFAKTLGTGNGVDLLHFSQPGSGTTWDSTRACHISTYDNALNSAVASCVRGDTIHLFFNLGGPTNFTLWHKYWTSTGGWSDSILVSGSDNLRQNQTSTAQKVSADYPYIPVMWTTTGNVVRANTVFMACDEPAADYYIYSLPFTVTDAMSGTSGDHTVIRIACDSVLHSTDQAIIFSTTDSIRYIDFLFDLNDSLYWGENGDHNEWGIALDPAQENDKIHHITFSKGNFVHNPPAAKIHPDTLLACQGMRFGKTSDVFNVVFDTTNFLVKGRNSQIAVTQSTIYNIKFYHCIFYDSMTAFTQRDAQADAAMISLTGMDDTTGAGFINHITIRQCSTAVAYWMNMFINGQSVKATIDSSHLFLDARNDLANNGMIGSAEQCYAIQLYAGTGAGHWVAKINDNTFRTGTSYGGGEGILLSTSKGADTTSGNCIEIYYNDFLIWKYLADEGNRTSTAIKLRQLTSGVWIHDNHIRIEADNVGGGYRSPQVTGIKLEQADYNPTLWKVTNNVIETHYYGTFTPDYITETVAYAACIELDGIDSTDASTIIIGNNKYIAAHHCILYGNQNADGRGITWTTLKGDTLSEADTSYNFETIHFVTDVNYATIPYTHNVILDPILETPASYSDVGWSGIGGTANGNISAKINATITVNSGGSPVSGADVYVWSDYGDSSVMADTIWHKTTNGSGQATGLLRLHFDDQNGIDTTLADHSPWIIRVSKAGYTTLNAAISFDWNDKDTTLNLTASGAPPKRFWRIPL